MLTVMKLCEPNKGLYVVNIKVLLTKLYNTIENNVHNFTDALYVKAHLRNGCVNM